MTRNEAERPTLPADITAMIFDLLATELEGPHEYMARQTLMNCSLCSKTCLWQCRKHIFAKLHFIVEESSCQTKAQTLLSVLQNPFNERILSAIRSFRLTIVSASGLLSAKHTRRLKWSNMRSSITKVGRRLSGGSEPVDFVFQLLDLLSRLPLDSFAVDAGPEQLLWLDVKESVKNIFFNFRSNEHLKSLEFTGVLDLDERLVGGSKPNNLKELKLRDVLLSGVYTTAMSNLANLQVLQVFADLEYMRFLPWGAERFRVFSTNFSQVRSLVLSYPLQPGEQTTFWNAVASLSGSLENLEIRNIPGAYNGISQDIVTLPDYEEDNIRLVPVVSSIKSLTLASLSTDLHLPFTYYMPVFMRFLQSTSRVFVGITHLTLRIESHMCPTEAISSMEIVQWHCFQIRDFDYRFLGDEFPTLHMAHIDIRFDNRRSFVCNEQIAAQNSALLLSPFASWSLNDTMYWILPPSCPSSRCVVSVSLLNDDDTHILFGSGYPSSTIRDFGECALPHHDAMVGWCNPHPRYEYEKINDWMEANPDEAEGCIVDPWMAPHTLSTITELDWETDSVIGYPPRLCGYGYSSTDTIESYECVI